MRRIRTQSFNQLLFVNVVCLASLIAGVGNADVPISYKNEKTIETKSGTLPTYQKSQRFAYNAAGADDAFFYPDEYIGTKKMAAPAALQNPEPVIKTDAGYNTSICSVEPAAYSSYAKFGTPYTINGVTYTPGADPFYNQTGTASWYGADFHGKVTANGETYDMTSLSAAHPTLPLPSYVRVQNLRNGRHVVVRVNDRGPFKKGRIIDVSKAAAQELDMIRTGTTDVRVEYLGPAEQAGVPVNCLEAYEKSAQFTTADIQMKTSVSADWKFDVSDLHFVQVGSFENQDNAQALLSEMKSHTQRADIVFANVNGNDRYRVVLGPFTNRNEADVTLSKMKSNGYNGLIIKNPEL